MLKIKITLPSAKLDIIGSRLVSNDLFFLKAFPVNLQLVTFLFLSNIMELSIGTKTRKFWKPSLPVKYILPNKKYPFSDICASLFAKSVIFFSASAYFVLFEVTF